MKTFAVAVASWLLVCNIAHSQAPYQVFTSPKLPPRDALERMRLKLAWHARVTVDGNRDGIASVQLLTGKAPQILVQTHKGGLFLYDADNGDLIWKTYVGVAYWTPQPAAFNTHSILVTRRSALHVVNRFDGSQRAFSYDPNIKQVSFGIDLSFAPNARPVADEDFVYVPMGNRMHTFFIPDYLTYDKAMALREKAVKEGRAEPLEASVKFSAPLPEFYWGYGLGIQLTTSSPLLFGNQVSMLTTDGTLHSVPRFNTGTREAIFEFKTTGETLAAPGQHRHMAFLASDDFNLYAVDMRDGSLAWRHVSGAPILTKPEVNDRDVYISPKRAGLRRLDRERGRAVWTNADTTRFLAANNEYVYALDQNGVFFVLDYRRGSTLAKLNLSDWKIALANEWTDRVYLAANDGQVMCLRHRDLAQALTMKTTEDAPPKEEKKPAPEPKADNEQGRAKQAVPPVLRRPDADRAAVRPRAKP